MQLTVIAIWYIIRALLLRSAQIDFKRDRVSLSDPTFLPFSNFSAEVKKYISRTTDSDWAYTDV